MPDQSEFSLSGLAMLPGFSDPAAMDMIKKRDVDKELETGEYERYAADERHDVLLKDIDGFIYQSSLISAGGTAALKLQNLQFERMHALLGVTGKRECVSWLMSHDKGDPAVVDALLSEAIAKGDPWQLPSELLGEYERRAGGTA